MHKTVIRMFPAGLAGFALMGCVSQGVYQSKELEAANLSQELAALKTEGKELKEQNDSLKKDFARLDSDFRAVSSSRDRVKKERDELEKQLQAKPDELTGSVADMRQRAADLEKENRKLKLDIENLHKAKGDKTKEVGRIYEKLLETMKSEIAQGVVTVSEFKGKLTVNVNPAVFFEPGKPDIRPEGSELLARLIPFAVAGAGRSVMVSVWSDIRQAAPEALNAEWELSAARSVAVARHMRRNGIDPMLPLSAGFPEYAPAAGENSMENRIEFILGAVN